MNAAIRAIVRVGLHRDCRILGVYGGFEGLISGDLQELDSRSVGNIIQRGGTILQTARCPAFRDLSGREKARENLIKNRVDILIVVGGDGSFRGCLALSDIWDGQVIGVPGTIDSDIYGTDETIGFDTAATTALDAIDKIRDTADSHGRFFVVEVMGRHSGLLAQYVGFAGGAEALFLPEVKEDIHEVCSMILRGHREGKRSSIIVVAEGNEGGGYAVARRLFEHSGEHYRVVVLGHTQRGGSPSARDRILATKLGAYAVEVALEGEHLVMTGEQSGVLATVPLLDAVQKKKPLDPIMDRYFSILVK